MHNIRKFSQHYFKLVRAYYGVLKKTSGIPNRRRIGQLTLPDIRHDTGNIRNCWLFDVPVFKFGLDSTVSAIDTGLFAQLKANRSNDVMTFQFIFKDTIAVPKPAIFKIKHPFFCR
ncbi:hypothetical protein D3C86_1749080 [compost metagenome]